MMARIIHEITFWTAVPFMGLAEYAVLITIIWVRNLEVGMQRPLLGVSQMLFPVLGLLRLQRVCLNSFWQCDQHDCTENTLDLVLVEVTEVGWISDLGVVSSGPVVGYTRLSAGHMVFLGPSVTLLAFPLEPHVNTEN